ncbi:MAG: malto-oligosyltrehalose trehalohydrolase [Candidatus Omnitrophica bacterium]|nr:malto-oligosyltrehalose trehalohydrolase [Candidatus Omnitrophota bacterium]
MKSLGSYYRQDGSCEFFIWAPLCKELSVVFHPNHEEKTIALTKDDRGYFHGVISNINPGTRYLLERDKTRRPDPASFFQPEDVLGPSALYDHRAFSWTDSKWRGIDLSEMIIYELHIGTFTEAGTFASAIDRLDDLCELGVTTVEIMPVAQFPGHRNWGYDGVYPFAVQHSYGGPDGLKSFVDAAHQRGLAVVLDVVYNHLGPEGNFLPEYMPCFSDHYKTPWGQAINFDGAYSYGVREYFIANALYWFEHFHVDGLRLDATHGIFDMSAKHFLADLSQRVEEFAHLHKRKLHLIAESDLNDRRVIDTRERGGYGLSAQWSDDFHHIVHALLTQESNGYYQDFSTPEQLAKMFKESFIYDGVFSEFRKRYHGNSAADLPAERFVVCVQNHDQIGNRLKGERLSSLVSFEAQKLAAGALILSPYLPLLFMGQEYGEKAPFLYFMSFQDEKMIQAVRDGRRREFKEFNWNEEPADPYALDTFARCKLNWASKNEGEHKFLLDFYKKLISLRKASAALYWLDKDDVQIDLREGAVIMHRLGPQQYFKIIMNFQDHAISLPWVGAKSAKVINSSERQWGGPTLAAQELINFSEVLVVAPRSILVYEGCE